MKLSARSGIGLLLSHPDGAALVAEYLPEGIPDDILRMGAIPVGMIARMEPALADPGRRAEFLARVEQLEVPDPVHEAPIPIRDDYDADAAPASASWHLATATPVAWRPVEIALGGPSHGNPFVEVELTATVTGPGAEFEVTGFYDGDGRYAVRFLPSADGAWSFRTHSNARSLDGVAGEVAVAVAPEGAHGPVRVNGFGFRYADGTRHLPLGTTAYAWTHQASELEDATLATLAKAPFTKIRFCVFPKHYLYNGNEPARHAFERLPDGGFDTQRFDPAFFRHFEERVADLDRLGIEADVILFHPYDRWGYADLGAAADDRYLRYVVARLSAHPNVWWSLANEFDLMGTKTDDDWERFATVIQANDPVGHLRGIHNCLTIYDHSREWVTHVSMQRTDLYRTAEETDAWRGEWGKPVVIDECAYEGNIDQGWGNITGEEMTRRFWEAAVRGGWCGHGETYWAADEVLWWSKGGVLKGDSPARIAFLRAVLEEAPGDLEPSPQTWDAPSGVVGDRYRLTYYSFMQPLFKIVRLPRGTRWRADVLDTWSMTVMPVPGLLEDGSRVELPGRPYIALRLVRVDGA